jgi:hypothetical protein
MPELKVFPRRGAGINYRCKGQVTRDKKKQRRYSPFSLWKRAEVRERQVVA